MKGAVDCMKTKIASGLRERERERGEKKLAHPASNCQTAHDKCGTGTVFNEPFWPLIGTRLGMHESLDYSQIRRQTIENGVPRCGDHHSLSC